MLTMEERGMLITAIFDYENDGTQPADLSPQAMMAFAFIRDQLDRDAAKYEKKCEKNRENGAKGGRPKGSRASEKTDRFSEKTKKADNDTGTDSNTDNATAADTANANEAGREEAEEADAIDGYFETFWQEYPKHFSYDEAKCAYRKNISSEKDAEEALALLERWKRSAEWTKDKGRWIRRADKFLTEIFPTRDEPPEDRDDGGSFDADEFFEAALRRSYAVTGGSPTNSCA